MSRCFPYPPPGYERKSVALDEALINSIKLQKEKEKAKKEKRKEKKRDKKEKEKARDDGGAEDKKHKHEKKHRSERGKVEPGVGDKRKRTEEEAEQLEKSGLTEEQEQPISSQNLYDSTDSTQNSHKRKKFEPPADGSNHNHGSIFRIRLKPKDQAVLLSKELQVPNSGRDDHTLQAKYKIPQILGEEKPFSTSGRQQQASTSGRTTFAKQDSLKQKDQDVLSNNDIGNREKIQEKSINNTARKESLKQKDQDILNKTNITRKESSKQKDHKISSYTNTARKENLKQKDQDTLNNGNIARKESSKQKDQEILCNPKVARKEDLKQKGNILSSTNVARKDSWKQKGQEIPNNTNIATKEILKQNQDVLSNKKLSPIAFSGPSLHEISPKISEVQNCPTSRITTIVQERFGNDSRPSEEQPCSTSGRSSIEALEVAEKSRKSSRKVKKIESLYRELIENWVPPVVENDGADFDDQDWLFERRPKSESEPKRSKPSNDVMCEGSSSLWPRARYLPEADVYALPYTVPF